MKIVHSTERHLTNRRLYTTRQRGLLRAAEWCWRIIPRLIHRLRMPLAWFAVVRAGLHRFRKSCRVVILARASNRSVQFSYRQKSVILIWRHSGFVNMSHRFERCMSTMFSGFRQRLSLVPQKDYDKLLTRDIYELNAYRGQINQLVYRLTYYFPEWSFWGIDSWHF